MEANPDGYEIDLFTSLTQPIMFAGVPRGFAILNGTITAVIALPLGLPLLAVPMGLAAQAVAAWMVRRDPYFFEILLRHVRQESYWD
jgi:type IV secretory pathway TrbD component